MTFADPWALWALLILPLLLVLRLTRERRRSGLAFADLSEASRAGRSLRQRLIQLPFALQLLALALLITGLARPQEGIEKIEQISHGIAMEIVVDRSSSMAETFVYQGRTMNRLEAVKLAFYDFVMGNNQELAGRPHDLVGMVAFARFAETICPLTLAHGAVAGFVKQVQLVSRAERHEDGTAMGDGLALAAARLRAAAEEAEGKGGYEIKSKIIILLTDGIHNSGQHSPLQAAALAKEWGIKIYTIGIGEATKPSFFSLGRGAEVDVRTLTALAEETGGRFWLASDGKALQEIYQTIDRLEKSEIESIRYMDYQEQFSKFVLAGLALLALSCSLKWTILAVLP
ncbi:MAG: VWA domain-containing protein [Desulfurivibrionaceae bacterium]|nr:VWA domain-containing protein [Desulfurivibrionaceae bacterium]